MPVKPHPEYGHAAAVRRKQAGNDGKRRRLPGAVRPEQSEKAAAFNGEGKFIQSGIDRIFVYLHQRVDGNGNARGSGGRSVTQLPFLLRLNTL